jgi:hypothetical protein
MSDNTSVVIIRGLSYESPINEFPVRAGPGTEYKELFKAAKGLTGCVPLEVRADEQGTTWQEGRVHHWFRLKFSDGREGWVRDHILEIQGDFSAFGYGIITAPSYAYLLVRTETPAAVKVVQIEKTALVTEPAPAPKLTEPPVSEVVAAPEVKTVAPSKPTGPCTGVVIASATARTRQGPSTSYPEGPLLKRNDRVPILEVRRGEGGDQYRWMRISVNGQTLWTRETNLSIEGDGSALGLPVDLYPRPMKDCWWVRGFEGGHKGWDLGARTGEPIYIGPFGGVATMTMVCTKCTPDKPNTPALGFSIGDERIFSDPGWGYGYGNWVIVRYLHDMLPQSTRDFLATKALAGAHLFVAYAHLHTIDVKQGQKLEGRALVGTCGNTGNSEATHLHLEVRAWKDPNETSWAKMGANVFDPIILFGR